MKKISIEKTIRIITLAPIMALIAISLLFALRPGEFYGAANYAVAILCLTVLPLLAYLLQPYIPRYKDQGRAGQRRLAIVMAVVGYLAGILCAVALHMPRPLAMIFACYLISGVFILLFNKVLRIRASGHSCGTTGPIAYLIYLIGAPALIGLPFLGMVYWASLRMKRHTFSELVLGGGIAVVAAVLGAAIFMP